MMITKYLTWLIVLFFAIIIALVFQQISTSMVEQGIASGGPYDNAASYPRAIAIIAGVLVALLLVNEYFNSTPQPETLSPGGMRRAIGLLVVFAVYLSLLAWLGYHLMTTPMVFAIMWIGGGRAVGKLLVAALTMSFVLAFIFENFLNVVLPGGVFRLNIPW